MSTKFSDQSEKFIFWRNIADRATYLKAFALVWTSESWLRDIKAHQGKPIRELPIIGEQLHVVGADANDAHEVVAWNIVRATAGGPPILEPLQPEDRNHRLGKIFFINPVIEAMKSVHFDSLG